MHWIAAKVVFECADPDLAADLITDLFDTLGVRGVVVDDPELQPSDAWASEAVASPTQPAVTAYLPGDARGARLCRDLERSMAALSQRHPMQYTIHYEQMDEEAWAESWKQFFHPQPITPRLVVKPTWCDYHPAPGQQIIEIDPGMAFGTGTHPTTAMCVQLLEDHLRPGRTLLDVGTGAGILMIAAHKLGAGQMTGVDNDPMAVSVARANLLQNAIPAQRFDLFCGHLVQAVSQTYDVVTANILAEVILELLPHLPLVLKPGGLFICSGIITGHRDAVVRQMEARGMRIHQEMARDDWVALIGRFRGC